MTLKLKRHPRNPIVTPGRPAWRAVTTFNPGVILDGGSFWMLERACSSLAPLYCQFGLLRSEDGVRFAHVVDHPVFDAARFGTPEGTVEDPRLVKYGDWFYMTYVHRNRASSCYPTGTGIPIYKNPQVPVGDPNNYRSGIARSQNLIDWEDLGLVTPAELDDRDCVLFPEMIGGRYAMLRRPADLVGPQHGCDRPSIWLSYSDDLLAWDPPVLVATPEHPEWEAVKIGAGSPPVKTEAGWICLYHGVDRDVVYRVGVMLLDSKDPSQVIARAPDFIMEPETYYERVGLIIPRVVFPSANVVKDGILYVYYGCADTCIGLATVRLERLLEYVLRYRR